jgi:Domain of unknown function (DUF4331)
MKGAAQKMRKLALIVLAATGAILLAAVSRGTSPEDSVASSHREAPLISEDPTADNTDLYAFRSPDKPNTLTIISNFIPAEDPAAGPNYYTFSPRARYNIHIDRTGDGRADIIYRFRFKSKPGQLFLGNTEQRYTVERITPNGRSQIIARGMTPPNNIGPRTLMGRDYRQLAASRVTNLRGGGLVFAGQRDDAFFADIGAIFDLLAIRKGTGDQGGGKDFFAGYAVHALALQIPISQLDTKSHVIGIWSSTERQMVRIHDDGNAAMRWMQVSRLGNPLVNEVIIPTTMKDLWNSRKPAGDKSFAKYYRTPILAKVRNQLYNLGVPEKNRKDLVSVLLTGVNMPKLNYTGPTLADMLRINLSIPVTPPSDFKRLGVLAGDLQGWPNGRRLGDDVVDIAERAVAGALVGKNVPLGDGVDFPDRPRLGVFPYEADPGSGFANEKGK